MGKKAHAVHIIIGVPACELQHRLQVTRQRRVPRPACAYFIDSALNDCPKRPFPEEPYAYLHISRVILLLSVCATKLSMEFTCLS